MKERIDKIISSQGKYTRTQVKKLIKSGGVKLNGKSVTSPDEKADAEADMILIYGQQFHYRRKLYIMMNKPQGVVSSTEEKGKKTVIDIVPDEFRRDGLFPAGRLDSDTTGFVLITDDGVLAHEILSPGRHVSKVYHARLEHPVSEITFEAFRKGAVLADGSVCMSAELSVIEDGENPLVRVVLHQGMYHQIKRMFASCSNKVISLHRIQIGAVKLDESLAQGECRLMTDDEVARLYE